MRINHNIAALNTYRQLSANNTNASKALEKLSSGLRINRAGDDAAGLAISEKMRGQIRGLNQASRNAQDGISLIQSAEGALNETHSILQRMRELAVQASNDTNTSSDRTEIQKEINQLNSEIDRIADTTNFNTQKLLNGGLGANGTSDDTTHIQVESVSGLQVGSYDFTIDTAATKAEMTGSVTYATAGALETAFAGGATFSINGVTITTDAGASRADILQAINDKSDETGFVASHTDTEGITFTATEFGSGKSLTISGTNANLIDNGTSTLTDGVDAVVTIAGPDETVVVTGTGQQILYGTAEFTAVGDTNGDTATVTVDSTGASIHIGADKDQTMYVDINEMSTQTLGNDTDKIKDVNVLTKSGAEKAITTVDDAIKQVSAERSKLGAFQNRLEHTINNLGTSAENLTAAESRIRDVDMAKEMMEFTKNNILTQAAQAMLAQANQQPQGVLQLLR